MLVSLIKVGQEIERENDWVGKGIRLVPTALIFPPRKWEKALGTRLQKNTFYSSKVETLSWKIWSVERSINLYLRVLKVSLTSERKIINFPAH